MRFIWGGQHWPPRDRFDWQWAIKIGPLRLKWWPHELWQPPQRLDLPPAHYGCSWMIIAPLGFCLSDHYRWSDYD